MELTITESLQRIKTLKSRLENKRKNQREYLCRDKKLKDPMESKGGSEEWIRAESQSIRDLENDLVGIRCAIQKKNLETMLTCDDVSLSVSFWLNWRREIAEDSLGHLKQTMQVIRNYRNEATKQNYAIARKETDTVEKEILINLDEGDLAERIDKAEVTLGELDGKLSLLNATTTIIIPD